MPHFDPFRLDGDQLRRSHRHRITRTDADTIDRQPDESFDQPALIEQTGRSQRLLILLISAVFLVLLARLFDMQIIRGEFFLQKSEGSRLRTLTIPAPRGSIIDRQGRVLAENVPNMVLTIVPADVPSDAGEQQRMIDRLAGELSMAATDITKLIQAPQRRRTDPIVVAEHLTYDQAIHAMITTSDIPGVTVQALPTRQYPYGPSLAHVLGYTGRISPAELGQRPAADPLDTVGQTGLERTFDEQLTGSDGYREIERDVYSREQRVLAQRDPYPGRTVVTTINAELQNVLFTKLSAMVKSVRSSGGAAVALNPQNGEVLAMASVPTYDDNWFVSSGHNQEISTTLTGEGKPLLNRAISGQYPSGSIIKPMIAATALEQNVVTPSTTVMSVGGFKVGNDFFPDWKAGGHGVTNITKAIAESVNTYFYAVGGGLDNITGLGVDRIVNGLQRFGWGKATGIDLPAEASGLLPTKDWRMNQRLTPWKLGDTYHLSIGQGDLEVTPLQVASAIATIANGGTLYQPHVVTAIRQADGKNILDIAPKILSSQVMPTSDLRTVQQGMRAGVVSGSSQALQSLPVSSAAKTGTAQFGSAGKTHAWFASYAPYDHPEIVIVVLIEGGGEGHATALPVARDVLSWYFTSKS